MGTAAASGRGASGSWQKSSSSSIPSIPEKKSLSSSSSPAATDEPQPGTSLAQVPRS
jgi:hypothetical protein